MLGAFETLYDRVPPAWLRKVEAMALAGVFAEAFEVEPPDMRNMGAAASLDAFMEFTAACMEAAQVDEALAGRYRERLGAGAIELGVRVRKMLLMRPSAAFRVTRFFYRGIGITIEGSIPGEIRFCPCAFAARYTPEDCRFMSAFDEGFMRGISGMGSADLVFSCRLTEGASCCRARFGEYPPDLWHDEESG